MEMVREREEGGEKKEEGGEEREKYLSESQEEIHCNVSIATCGRPLFIAVRPMRAFLSGLYFYHGLISAQIFIP